MIVKKITPKDIGRAVGFELMKLRWKYGIRIKHAAHLSGIDIKQLDAAEVGRFTGWETTAVCSNCMTLTFILSLFPEAQKLLRLFIK